MSITTRGAVLALLVGGPLLGVAQQTPATWPKQGQLIEEGVVLHDKEDYPGAIAKYQAVTPGDTLYALAQSELALSLSAAGKHEEAVAAAKRAIAIRPFVIQSYYNLADAQEQLKQNDAAAATYQQALKLFPYNPNLYYNQAQLLMRQHKLAEALSSAERSLELDPLSAPSHRLLGTLAAQQGQTAHTLTSLLTFLLINKDNSTSNEVLVLAEKVSQGAPIVEASDRLTPVAPNEAFTELDQLLDGKVALQPSYKTKVRFNAALVKQTQLLVEKFPVDGPASDFWVRAYGPMMAVLRRDDNLTTFTYLVLRATGDRNTIAWLKVNKPRMTKMLSEVLTLLLALREQPLVAGGTPGQRQRAWYNNDGLVGLGPGTLVDDKFTATGDWTDVSAAGAIESKGQYTPAGKRTGLWTFFRPNGRVSYTQLYNDQGELEGVEKNYHLNGNLSLEVTYAHNKLNGLTTHYDQCGNRLDTQNYEEDLAEGLYSSYYATGQLQYQCPMQDGKNNGPETAFYADGTPEFTATMVAGKRQGPSRTYLVDKTLEKELSYDQGELHGDFKRYHANGTVSETGRYEHGKRTGLWHEYTADTKLSVNKNYDEAGELHGLYQNYDAQGHLYGTTEYTHGRVKQWEYFDAAGKSLVAGVAGKGRTAARLLDAEGHLSTTGDYIDGRQMGEWKGLYADGAVQQAIQFDSQGKQAFSTEVYYANGQLERREHQNPEGQQDGYYEKYYVDGVPQQMGYFRNGQRQGPWRSYYANGQVEEEYEYHRGQLNGALRNYAPSGKIAQERLYEYGKLHVWISYDSTGQVVNKVELKPDSKEMLLGYQNSTYRSGVACFELSGPANWLQYSGKPIMQFSHLAGQRDGSSKTYRPDGKLKVQSNFHNDWASGEWLEYDADGKLYCKRHYNTAGEHGESSYYFPNGQLAFTETYLNGQLHGPMRRYNPAGELLIEKRYELGSLRSYRGPGPADAPWKMMPLDAGIIKIATTFANGKPAAEETFQHGWLAGPVVYYYASGAVYRRNDYLKTVRSGLTESFYPNGKIMERENYLHGLRHGRCRYYRPDGTLEREESYLCGELNGPTTFFDAAGQPLRTEQYWNTMLYGKK